MIKVLFVNHIGIEHEYLFSNMAEAMEFYEGMLKTNPEDFIGAKIFNL